MAEQEEISDPRESLVDKISDKLHGSDDTSSSYSYSEPKIETTPPSPPVHTAFGGGKPADIVLWRNKKISASVLGVSTAIWVLFELLEYHLLTLLCHIVIFALSLLFLWSNVTTIINKRPPQIPEICLPADPFADVALALRVEINRVLVVLRGIASGRDLKKFLLVVFGLWVLSIVGSFVNFLTLFYIAFVFLHTVPVLYEKYDDKIYAFAEKASIEVKKQYALFNNNVLSKIHSGPKTRSRLESYK